MHGPHQRPSFTSLFHLISHDAHIATHTPREYPGKLSLVECGWLRTRRARSELATTLKLTLAVSTLLTPLSPGMRGPDVSAHERRAGSLYRNAALRAPIGIDWHRPKE
eukprot:scaffold100274_cov67-Phaeocystis_antarctica.AAC.1